MQDAGIDAADAIEIDVAAVIDVDDRHADFVCVTDNHHAEGIAALERRDDVVMHIGANVGAEAADIGPGAEEEIA